MHCRYSLGSFESYLLLYPGSTLKLIQNWIHAKFFEDKRPKICAQLHKNWMGWMNRIHNSLIIFSGKKWLAEFLTLNYADDADFCKPTQPCCHHFEVQCRYDELVHRRLVLQGRSWYGFDGFGRSHQFSKTGSRTHQFLRKINRNSAY